MNYNRCMNEILLVEDDRFFRQLYADQLRHAGYAVTTADSGEEAMTFLDESRYGLVITDMTMPGISGLDLLVKIKSLNPSIDVILITANADLESAVFSLKHGARDYLIKPINSDELLHAVRLCMEQRRLINENQELRNMVGLLQTSQALSSSMDLEGVCHLAVDAIAREVGVERGACLVYSDDDFTVRHLKGINESLADVLKTALLPACRKRPARIGQPIRVLLPSGYDQLEAEEFKEAVLFPLAIRNCCHGIIVLFNDPGAFIPAIRSERNLAFLQEHGARALDNALRFTSTKDMLYIDELSGLFNYRYLKVALEREIKRADRYSTPLSVVFIDLDNFKQVNDTYGHLVGSSLLKEVGSLLKRMVREVDVVIRYGGDEYTIILLETDPETALKVAERIRKLIDSHQFLAADGYHLRLTASLGVSSYPDDTTGVNELLSMADKAMYASKAAGKNCVYRVTQILMDTEPKTEKEL